MLVSIILFLSLISSGWTIVKIAIAIFERDSRKSLDLAPTFISIVITCALFSLFYYLTH